MESTAMWHCVSFQNYIPPHVTRTQRKDKYLQAAVKGFLSMADQGLLQSGHTRVPKRHMCDMCHLTFAIARVLETHKMLEHQVSPGWTCDECGMQFLQSLSYKLHMVRSHKPYPCGFPGCLASYGNKADLTVHAMSHKDEQPQVLEVDEEGNPKTKRRPVFKCHLCPAEYPHMCKLRYHMRKHTGERPFKCSECSSSFQTSSQRLGHIRRTHIRVRKHLCDLCGKKFKDSRTLREHSGTHSGVKPYSCPVCSRGFSKRAAMFVHIRQHTGEKPYVCDQCGQSFTVRVSLRTHLKSKHNIIVDTGTFKRREDDPGDNSIPLIGRPKRKDAEKQLSLVAKSRASQGQNELRLEHSHSGCNSANSADSESGTSVPSLSNRSSESTRCQNSFSHGSCTPVQPEPKREQSLLPDVRTVTLNPVPFYETNLPMYSSVFQVGDNSDGPVEERAALGQEDLQSRALVGSASGVSNTSSSVSSVVYNGYPVKPPKY